MDTFNANEIISMFHHKTPVSYSVQEIRTQENDCRYILYVDFSEEKYIIKLASNGFTTEGRINGWADLIAQYRELGCYSPPLHKSVSGRYAERFDHGGKTFLVWEEEFAKYPFPNQVEHKPVNAVGTRYVYQDEVIAFFGKVGQLHLKNTWGTSGWTRFVPFGADEQTDEVMDCVETLDQLVNSKTPHLAERWQRVLNLFLQNREQLTAIYPKLPTSVFQAD